MACVQASSTACNSALGFLVPGLHSCVHFSSLRHDSEHVEHGTKRQEGIIPHKQNQCLFPQPQCVLGCAHTAAMIAMGRCLHPFGRPPRVSCGATVVGLGCGMQRRGLSAARLLVCLKHITSHRFWASSSELLGSLMYSIASGKTFLPPFCGRMFSLLPSRASTAPAYIASKAAN
jgi:hypothetical protein